MINRVVFPKFFILLIFIFLGVFKINLCPNSINNSLTASSINQNVNNTLIGTDINSVDKKFKEIRDIPYKEKSMNLKINQNYLIHI